MVSGAFAFLLFVLAYEVVDNARYERWKREYDNSGWFGRMTVASSNADLMWEYMPYGEFENIRTNRYGFRDDDYELADVNARISNYLLDHDVRVLDLLDAFRQQGRAPRYFTKRSVWHPNAKGHEIIATAVFREFAQRIRDADQRKVRADQQERDRQCLLDHPSGVGDGQRARGRLRCSRRPSSATW